MTSLAMNNWLLGESDGASKRIEMVGSEMDVVIVNKWAMGLNGVEGIERVIVGARTVGGSYLCEG